MGAGTTDIHVIEQTWSRQHARPVLTISVLAHGLSDCVLQELRFGLALTLSGFAPLV